MPPSSAQNTFPISGATEELITLPLLRLRLVSHERPPVELELGRDVPLPPFLGATLRLDRRLAASPIPGPAVEDHLARRAVEDILKVRVPLWLGARDDQKLLGHRRPRRPNEHCSLRPLTGCW